MTTIEPLGIDSLYKRCDSDQFSFETTAELPDLAQMLGQDRVRQALDFGVGIQRQGYNLYALGPSGIGKHTTVRQFLEKTAAQRETPPDWCYVNNFDEANRPAALALPPGSGKAFRDDMDKLVDELTSAIPAAFETEEYRAREQEIEQEFQSRREEAFSKLSQEAEQHGISLIRTPGGFAFAPVKDGEVIGPDEYDRLSDDERTRIENEVASLQEQLNKVLRQIPQWQREARDKLKELNQEVARYAVEHLIEDLKEKYTGMDSVVEHLDAMQRDVVHQAEDFLADQEKRGSMMRRETDRPSSSRRYEVNLIVDRSDLTGAPIVYEDTPTYQNLIGTVEHLAQMGALVTDFMLIKSGALHRANGGYLMLDAHKVLMQPYAWEGLKRALYSKEVRIQSLGQLFSLISTLSLEPEPIPLDCKVVLLGDRLLYYLLSAYDPDFDKLFKVSADFEDRIPRSADNYEAYAQLIGTVCRKEDLRALNRGGVARVIEYSARLVEDGDKLSTHMMSVADLLREADYWATQNGRDIMTEDDVQQAIDTRTYRLDRMRERIYEEIDRGTILIDTDGERTAQINGLSVLDLGNFSFGQPTRITATARLGDGEVVDIEREAELGGSIHSKGVLILSSFIASRYTRNQPLSLAASLVFEQSYGQVEGDSASMGELCALLSALGDVPVRQSLAITGSVDQHGQAQAIGGVNEKIEGFFDVCRARGLTGEQGVLIPESNVKHLMLRHDVVDAARQGQFHVYPVSNVDQAIELLTGMSAGVADEQGNYPAGSVNARVQTRLDELAEHRQEFAKAAAKELASED